MTELELHTDYSGIREEDVGAIATNWFDTEDNRYVDIFLHRFSKNIKPETLAYKLDYYFLLELVCNYAQSEGVFEELKCAPKCSCNKILTKMGHPKRR